ncbi:MAG: hypothetical protein ABSA26_07900 [Thermoguttaceae bacterium]
MDHDHASILDHSKNKYEKNRGNYGELDGCGASSLSSAYLTNFL